MNLRRTSWLLLIGLQPIWFGIVAPLAPSMSARVIGAVALTLPLLAPLPGIWRRRPRAELVGGMLLLIYFCLAVTEAWVDPVARGVALVQVALITAYYTGLWRRRKAKS